MNICHGFLENRLVSRGKPDLSAKKTLKVRKPKLTPEEVAVTPCRFQSTPGGCTYNECPFLHTRKQFRKQKRDTSTSSSNSNTRSVASSSSARNNKFINMNTKAKKSDFSELVKKQDVLIKQQADLVERLTAFSKETPQPSTSSASRRPYTDTRTKKKSVYNYKR